MTEVSAAAASPPVSAAVDPVGATGRLRVQTGNVKRVDRKDVLRSTDSEAAIE